MEENKLEKKVEPKVKELFTGCIWMDQNSTECRLYNKSCIYNEPGDNKDKYCWPLNFYLLSEGRYSI